MTTELRRAARYPIVASVEVRQRKSRVRIRARTSDLSISGCYIDTLNPLPDGTDVELQIVHGNETVTVSGRVAYSRANLGMGVHFNLVDDRQLEIFQKWIASVLPPP
jgi:PilZ domain